MSRKSAVKENVKLDKVENVDLQVKETTSRNSYTDVAKDVKTNVVDKSVTTITETEYSAPDLSGKQRKTREKTTETRNYVQTINEANERNILKQTNEIKRLTVDNSELRTKLNTSLSEKTKTTTRSQIWLYSIVIGVGVCVILLRIWIRTKLKS